LLSAWIGGKIAHHHTTEEGMGDSRVKDTWQAGDVYESYVGRWSRPVAREFLQWLAVPDSRDWIDIGCGTGALTQTILDCASPRSVLAIDPSQGFIDHAKANIGEGPVRFQVGDAQALAVDDSTCDAAVSGLVLNFVPSPARAVKEMTRVIRAGGAVAAYVWDYAGKIELMRYFWDAAVALDSAAQELDEGRRFPICNPERLTALFAEAGLQHISVRPIDVHTVFRSFDDYWSPFLGGQGPAPGYAVSLSEERRNVLRDRIRASLPTRPDGSIDLLARAWAIRGSKQ
jgi:SAM-dependent methyltransferase